MPDGLSVIVCSYNPGKEIFERVLRALAEAALPPEQNTECIIVDNNSSTPLADEKYVQELLARLPAGRIIIEKQLGLTQARMRGIKEALYNDLMFIDDDNEISSNYLIEAMQLREKYPFIAAFNAGIIEVEYTGSVEDWYNKKGKSHFQQSAIPFTVWGNDNSSYRHWPFGTGMLVKKEVGDLYISKVQTGVFTLTDRKGGVLTSGGDGQLVSCALEMGYGIGRAKELALRHLIAPRKANTAYLTKMDYGIYYSNEWFVKECFPENLVYISGTAAIILFITTFLRGIIHAVRKNDFKTFSIQMASIAGRLSGNRHVYGKAIPWWLKWFSNRYL